MDLPAGVVYPRKGLRRPNRKVYGMLCMLIFVMAAYRAVKVTKQPSWKPRSQTNTPMALRIEGAKTRLVGRFLRESLSDILDMTAMSKRTVAVAFFMTEDPICVWSIVNLAFCLLMLVLLKAVTFMFGPIYPTEQRPLYRKVFQFGFNKMLFVFGVLECGHVDDVLFWFYWLATVGALRVIILLCKYRQALYTIRAMTVSSVALRRLWMAMATVAIVLAVMTRMACHIGDDSVRMLMPVLLLSVALCQRVVCNAMSIEYAMEKRSEGHYYVTLGFDACRMLMETFTLLYELKRGRHGPIALAVIGMQLYRMVMQRALGRYGQHVHYMATLGYVRTRQEEAMSPVSEEELSNHVDVCAVCWFAMESAVKLHCGHMYHRSCVRKWLMENRTCPLCRAAVPPPPVRRMNPDSAFYANHLIESLPSLAWLCATKKCLQRCLDKLNEAMRTPEDPLDGEGIDGEEQGNGNRYNGNGNRYNGNGYNDPRPLRRIATIRVRYRLVPPQPPQPFN